MAARSKSNVEKWFEFDVASLPKGLAVKYKAFKEASKEAAIAREAFNEAFKAELEKKGMVEDGMYPVVAHNFGKLSYGLTDQPPTERRSANKASF